MESKLSQLKGDYNQGEQEKGAGGAGRRLVRLGGEIQPPLPGGDSELQITVHVNIRNSLFSSTEMQRPCGKKGPGRHRKWSVGWGWRVLNEAVSKREVSSRCSNLGYPKSD